MKFNNLHPYEEELQEYLLEGAEKFYGKQMQQVHNRLQKLLERSPEDRKKHLESHDKTWNAFDSVYRGRREQICWNPEQN